MKGVPSLAPQMDEALFQMMAEVKREGLSWKTWPSSPEWSAAAPAGTKMNLDSDGLSFLWVGLRQDLDGGVEMAAAVG